MFTTFKPNNKQLKKNNDCYKVDLKQDNNLTVYDCFPHYNNTISVYKSHQYIKGNSVYKQNGIPLQIFTPLRSDVLQIQQIGPVERFVIVFKPFGINQFLTNIDFSNIIDDLNFFDEKECNHLFNHIKSEEFLSIIEPILLNKITRIENVIIENSIDYIFKHYDDFTVNQLADYLGFSRKHINRVFKENIGVSIKNFHEIVLFRKTIEEKLLHNPDETFTSIAHKLNFTDQSHFNRLYKKFVSESPNQFYKNGELIGEEDTFWRFYKD